MAKYRPNKIKGGVKGQPNQFEDHFSGNLKQAKTRDRAQYQA
jgi:hypothetical protein